MCFQFPPTSLANKYTECINRKQNPNTQKNQKKKSKKYKLQKKNTTHIQIVVITKENIQKTKKKIQNRCLKKRTKVYVYFKARRNTK